MRLTPDDIYRNSSEKGSRNTYRRTNCTLSRLQTRTDCACNRVAQRLSFGQVDSRGKTLALILSRRLMSYRLMMRRS